MGPIRRKWLRYSILLLGVVVAIAWLSSYFVGMDCYRSNWTRAGTTTTERASWVVSNFGSFGIAWRYQVGDLGAAKLPDDASRVQPFRGSPQGVESDSPRGMESLALDSISARQVAVDGKHGNRLRTSLPALLDLARRLGRIVVRIGQKEKKPFPRAGGRARRSMIKCLGPTALSSRQGWP